MGIDCIAWHGAAFRCIVARNGPDMTRTPETRWIALATDGRHVTLGRHTDPSEDEIKATETALAAQGLSGFLAVLRGGYYTRNTVELLQVRPLATAMPDQWEGAVAAFLAKRVSALAP
jgi:hypothetical protein